MAVVGVDFGCLNAVMAQAERGGVKVLLNENSKRLNANMVSIQGKQRFLGEAAVSMARSNYKNTVTCMKRFIGRKFSEPELQEEMKRIDGLKFVEMPDGLVGVEVMYQDAPLKLSMSHVCCMMLFKMSQICAENNAGAGIADCVVSVPAWFTNTQRLAMLDACEIAGIRCLRLMHDTTATALEYGIWRSAKKMFEGSERVMFIDMGYSSYQVSVVDYVIGKLTVLATTFDRCLGGRDFDLAIAKFLGGEFKAKYGVDPMDSPKPRMKLLDAAEKAKMTLSPHGVAEANVYVECLAEDRDFTYKLTLEKFNELVSPLLERLVAPVLDALAVSKTEVAQLFSIEITGGGSRVASVKHRLGRCMGLDDTKANYGLKTTLNADECTSKGCAMQAAMLSPRFKVKEYTILEAAPLGVKLSWEQASSQAAAEDAAMEEDGETCEESTSGTTEVVLFARHSETPATKRITFRRAEQFSITASYDEASAALLSEGCDALIGTFAITGVPAPTPAEPTSRVRVHVAHSIHGTVTVASAQLVREVEDEEPAANSSETKEDSKEDAKSATCEESKGEESKKDPPAAGNNAGGEDAPKKKRKYKKTPLVVECAVRSMDKASITATIELEAEMCHQDRVIQETCDTRNELEAYIYKMRDDIIGDLRPYATDGDKTTFEHALAAAENWLYDGGGDDCTKDQYTQRLGDLVALGAPIDSRCAEARVRPELVTLLQAKIEELKTFANSSAPEHVDQAEKDTVRGEASKTEDWLMDLLDKQGGLALSDPPALTSGQLKTRLSDVVAKVKPILTKPKPKPKPVVVVPEPAAPADEEKKTDAADDKTAEPDAAQHADVKMDDAPAADDDKPKADAVEDETMPDAAPAEDKA